MLVDLSDEAVVGVYSSSCGKFRVFLANDPDDSSSARELTGIESVVMRISPDGSRKVECRVDPARYNGPLNVVPQESSPKV